MAIALPSPLHCWELYALSMLAFDRRQQRMHVQSGCYRNVPHDRALLKLTTPSNTLGARC